MENFWERPLPRLLFYDYMCGLRLYALNLEAALKEYNCQPPEKLVEFNSDKVVKKGKSSSAKHTLS